jgi:hypothetical protein
MNEKMFAPKMEASNNLPEEGEVDKEKRIKFETAQEDGECLYCSGEYKKGDKIAMYKKPEPNASDEEYKPYHNDCLDKELNPELMEK